MKMRQQEALLVGANLNLICFLKRPSAVPKEITARKIVASMGRQEWKFLCVAAELLSAKRLTWWEILNMTAAACMSTFHSVFLKAEKGSRL